MIEKKKGKLLTAYEVEVEVEVVNYCCYSCYCFFLSMAF